MRVHGSGSTATRVALVTGSTQGIGLAVAERLLAEGYEVAFHSRQSVAAGTALAERYAGASYTQADLAEPDALAALVPRVLEQHGRLDVLVNNAGDSVVVPHDDLQGATPELWRVLYEVNVIAPWALVTAAESALRDAAGPDSSGSGTSSVLNISSHAGVRPKGASIPYAVSKAALNHMTRLLARTLGPSIRVNAIAPGLVSTPLTADWEQARQLWREQSPMGRGAEPAEIADLAFGLIRNDYVTGEVILADGGLNLT